MFSREYTNLIQKLARQCLGRGILLVTAESCTGGLLSSLLTQEAGSSKWFDRGFITYSNNSKIDSSEEVLSRIEFTILRILFCSS